MSEYHLAPASAGRDFAGDRTHVSFRLRLVSVRLRGDAAFFSGTCSPARISNAKTFPRRVEPELGLHPRGITRRCAGQRRRADAQGIEDLTNDLGVGDRREHLHLVRAPRAHQHVEAPDAFHPHGPLVQIEIPEQRRKHRPLGDLASSETVFARRPSRCDRPMAPPPRAARATSVRMAVRQRPIVAAPVSRRKFTERPAVDGLCWMASPGRFFGQLQRREATHDSDETAAGGGVG
jgi:hypothetical protein